MSETINHAPSTTDTLIEKYIRLRDRISDLKEAHKIELARYTQAQDALEGVLLGILNQAGLDSMRGASGTVFKSTRTSAKVIDREAFLGFVREHNAWDLIESRVSKTAAQAIIEDTQHPIPGVETSAEVCCNVRRAAPAGK